MKIVIGVIAAALLAGAGATAYYGFSNNCEGCLSGGDVIAAPAADMTPADGSLPACPGAPAAAAIGSPAAKGAETPGCPSQVKEAACDGSKGACDGLKDKCEEEEDGCFPSPCEGDSPCDSPAKPSGPTD